MRVMFLIMWVSLVLVLCGCYEQSDADRQQAAETERLTSEAFRQVGMPDITRFTEKKLAKDIYELRDRADLTTWTYIIDLNGKLHLLGQSIGYGLPYSVQYTNPMKREQAHTERYTIPQPEANGLFMPDGLSATWVLLIDPNDGKPKPVYVEPQILVSPFPLPSSEIELVLP